MSKHPHTTATFLLRFGVSFLSGCSAEHGTPATHLGNAGNAGNAGSAGGGSATTEGGATAGGQTTQAAGSTARPLIHADFQSSLPGAYTQAMVAGDFSGQPSWNDGLDEGRATIVDENGERYLRVTYTAGVYGPADGGVQFIVPLSNAFDELYLSYRIRFANGFDFVRGGKLPGLVGGSHPTGCVADDAGFSARMMWRPAGAAVQYLYFPEKVNACGDDYFYQVAGKGSVFAPGQWHQVQHRIVMNTPGAHDGVLQAWFDGVLALDNQTFMYRTAAMSFGIDALYFSTFFGGSDATWAPTTAQVADFDDFVVSNQPLP